MYIGDKLLLRFRDSLTLLPNPLESLAKTLCRDLGKKGSIPHRDLKVSNLQDYSADVISYLRQDILLLGGVVLKAQEINWVKYQIDIEDVMTLSALSLKIFRKDYLDDEAFIIHLRKTKTLFLGVHIMGVMLMSISPMVRILTIMMSTHYILLL